MGLSWGKNCDTRELKGYLEFLLGEDTVQEEETGIFYLLELKSMGNIRKRSMWYNTVEEV